MLVQTRDLDRNNPLEPLLHKVLLLERDQCRVQLELAPVHQHNKMDQLLMQKPVQQRINNLVTHRMMLHLQLLVLPSGLMLMEFTLPWLEQLVLLPQVQTKIYEKFILYFIKNKIILKQKKIYFLYEIFKISKPFLSYIK